MGASGIRGGALKVNARVGREPSERVIHPESGMTALEPRNVIAAVGPKYRDLFRLSRSLQSQPECIASARLGSWGSVF